MSDDDEAARKLGWGGKMVEWRPIETAPVGDEPVMGYGEWRGELHSVPNAPEVVIMSRCGDEWFAHHGEYYAVSIFPTHWAPLPEGPRLNV